MAQPNPPFTCHEGESCAALRGKAPIRFSKNTLVTMDCGAISA